MLKAEVFSGECSLELSKHDREASKLSEFFLSSCVTQRGYRAAVHYDCCPFSCMFLVSIANPVVLENVTENAASIDVYT